MRVDRYTMKLFRRNYFIAYTLIFSIIGLLFAAKFALPSNVGSDVSETICFQDDKYKFPIVVVCSPSLPNWVGQAWTAANGLALFSAAATFDFPRHAHLYTTGERAMRMSSLTYLLLALPHYLALVLIGSWAIGGLRNLTSAGQSQA